VTSASLLSIVVGSATAQGARVQQAGFDTRAKLEAEAAAAESAHRTSEAWLLRTRLKNGDFQEGDRIVIVLESNPGVTDTLQLRAGKVLQLPHMADLSLEGVLRSELTDTLRHHLSRFLTNPGVRATPLLPLGVFGSVRNPGYYYSPADVVLRDVIMRAGGPLADADMSKVVVRRSGQAIWSSDDVRVALTDGMSLDRLHLRAGDEVFIPQQRHFQMTTLISLMTASVALVLAFVNSQH
jgi:protein involved in polysaccharide export with SLBB domain